MADPIESIAVAPNPSANFDEVWMIVNRANGRFVERMARRMEAFDCGGDKLLIAENQLFLDSAVKYADNVGLTSVQVLNNFYYTITSPSHGYSNGDTVRLYNVAGVPTLTNTTWVIGNVTTDTFDLATQVT